MHLDINTDALKEHSRKLSKISRSALPVAIRESLNDCAKDMKTNTLMKTSKDSFINRQANFFKANSRYERADGFNVDAMKATAGMTEGGLKGGNNYAVKDLEEQETGGEINKKSFIPTKQARTGNNPNKNVRANARLKAIRTIVKASAQTGGNKGVKFIKAVYEAGKGGFFLSDLSQKETLFKVDAANNHKFKLTPLYSFKKGRSVHVKPHHFVERAAEETHKKVDDYYIKRAEKAVAKYL